MHQPLVIGLGFIYINKRVFICIVNCILGQTVPFNEIYAIKILNGKIKNIIINLIS